MVLSASSDGKAEEWILMIKNAIANFTEYPQSPLSTGSEIGAIISSPQSINPLHQPSINHQLGHISFSLPPNYYNLKAVGQGGGDDFCLWSFF